MSETTAATGSNTVSLVKGQNVPLTKENPGLTRICFGLSWDLQDSATFDLDGFAIPIKADGKQHSPVLYFGSPKTNNPANPKEMGMLNNSLLHSGDNRTGEGEGDDEVITVDTTKLPTDVEKVVLAINIYEAKSGQNFGQVKGASCRVFDESKPNESIAKYDLAEDFSTNTAVIMGELYKKDGEWKFKALGQGATGDINQITAPYN